jgi:hypothetical protein
VLFNFVLDKPAAQDGYIVQENIIDFEFESCSEIVHNNPGDHFWEAWLVKANQTVPTSQIWGSTDSVFWDGYGATTGAGGVNLGARGRGTIKFFFKTRTGDLGDPATIPPTPPAESTGWTWRVSSPWSLDLPSTRIKPTWWDDPPDNDEAAAGRGVYVVWDCCCAAQKSGIMVTPTPRKK